MHKGPVDWGKRGSGDVDHYRDVTVLPRAAERGEREKGLHVLPPRRLSYTSWCARSIGSTAGRSHGFPTQDARADSRAKSLPV
jgi:hypothetical protein